MGEELRASAERILVLDLGTYKLTNLRDLGPVESGW